MIPLWLAATAFVAAVVPFLLYVRNVRAYLPPPATLGPLPPAAVLIPARNEEAGIRGAVECVLASAGLDFECIILDDHSTDGTAAVVKALAATDRRVRLEPAPPLPAGWSGKQHACYTLANLARHPVLVFLDADVRLAPDGLSKTVAFLHASNASLVSGFPQQQTGTPFEKLVIPLIHFVLLGFLPLHRMRRDPRPALGAGCGQLFAADRDAYLACGGHSHHLVRSSFHDGVKLPRAFRSHGFRTDLFDATAVATCRMYRTARQVWNGLAKNAGEGMGAPRTIPFFTVVLLLGQVLPWVGLIVAAVAYSPREAKPFADGDPMLLPHTLLAAAAVSGLAIRFDAAARFRQSYLGALLHPLGVAFLLAIQWYALFRTARGKPVGWKGRTAPGLSWG